MSDRNEARILIACMPTSGSSFLCRSIHSLVGIRRERLVCGFERREQELCVVALNDAQGRSRELKRDWKRRRLRRKLKVWKKTRPVRRPTGYVAQQHVRYSETTKALIEDYNLKPVVLVRNIFDVVPSIQDHYRKFSLHMPMAYVDDRIAQMGDAEVQDFIVDMVLPWYFNFYVSWQGRDDCMRVTYDEVMADKEGTILRILEYAGADRKRYRNNLGKALIRADAGFTRKNVGKSGRGAAISEENKARIRKMASYYPDVDFSPIGL